MSPARLTARIVDREALSVTTIDRLYQLYDAYYENVTRAIFAKDLSEKNWVILLEDIAEGQVRGFSTLMLNRESHGGKPVASVFSGDTIIDPDYWGDQSLVRAWCSFMGRLLTRYPEDDLYWFLLTKGYRTYLYLPLYFHEFFPRHDAPTPEYEQRLLDHLARAKFQDAYDPTTGLITFEKSLGNLTGELAEISPHRRQDPHVKYFLERNPRFAEGVELACLARIVIPNIRGLALRMVRVGMAEEQAQAAGEMTTH